MKKTITINVPEPCHEGWENMSPTQKGRFCSSCEKEVVDFSKKTDEELVKELAGKTNLCGRFSSSQLNRPVTLERKSSTGFLPYAASLMLPLSIVGSNPSNNFPGDTNFTSLGIGRYSDPDAARYQITTVGKITDVNGKPVFNVEILSKESRKSELSGMRGDYEIKSFDRDILLFKKEGYVSQEVKLGSKSGTLDIILHTIPQNIEVMVVGGIGAVEDIEVELKTDMENAIPICYSNEDEELIEGEILMEKDNSEEKDVNKGPFKLKGTVTDKDKLPLPGANVIIDGTTTGTQTDFDGNFEIKVEPGQSLQFSYVGFETQNISIEKNQPVNIKMVMDSMVLGGYIGLVVTQEYRGHNLNNAKYIVEPESYPESEYTLYTDGDRKRWREKNKKAEANEVAFKQILQARKKAARTLRKSKRKKK
jgi:hypothetical protein